MRCLTCHYLLEHREGVEHRCPECGTPFDPNDPETFETVSSAWQGNTRMVFVAVCIAAILAAAIALLRGMSPTRVLTAILIAILVSWAILRFTGLRHVRRMTRD